jgi:hypothetical protein
MRGNQGFVYRKDRQFARLHQGGVYLPQLFPGRSPVVHDSRAIENRKTYVRCYKPFSISIVAPRTSVRSGTLRRNGVICESRYKATKNPNHQVT